MDNKILNYINQLILLKYFSLYIYYFIYFRYALNIILITYNKTLFPNKFHTFHRSKYRCFENKFLENLVSITN